MLIATHTQIYALAEDGGTVSPVLVFEGEGIQCLVEGRRISAIGLAGGGIALLSGGEARRLVTGITESVECLALLAEDPLRLLIGTEPPHLYQLAGEEGPAQRLAAFDELACRDRWYTPWGGPPAVRSLARSNDWVYADIHVGSIMRSPDQGASWEPVEPELHEDVHQVATSPALKERVYANTAAAVYLSEDRGQSWQHRAEGLEAPYGRAVVVHPEDPDCILASFSKGPGTNVQGRLYRSDDGGRTWSHVTEGFPSSTRDNIDTFHLAFSARGTAWAVVESTLYRSADQGHTWEVAWQAPDLVAAISCATPENY